MARSDGDGGGGGGGGRRVAVIGAGCSGLTAIKACLEEGLTPVCLESSDQLGGLWRFREGTEAGQGCVNRSTVSNTSKEVMTYSDFPVPDHFPNFLHNTKVLEYFQLYARHFGLERHIRYGTHVTAVTPATDYEESGQWVVESTCGGQRSREVYAGVMLCTGHHAQKHMAQFPGEADFRGRRIHTQDYKDSRGFQDKRVVVIGIGNSGADVTSELSRVCKQVFLSTRRGAWVYNRLEEGGVPYDMAVTRRVLELYQWLMPRWLRVRWEEARLNARFDHATYGLRPGHPVDAQHPTMSDDLPNRILCGDVTVKPNVTTLTATGVAFDDGTVEDDIDVVIYATGYKFGFPFVQHPALAVRDNQVDLYKLVFPPSLPHPTLAVVGVAQPLGSIIPTAELQCRWITKVMKGDYVLPSAANMIRDIRHRESRRRSQYVASQRHTIQVDWIPYMDELADCVGCRPNLLKLLFTDPRLAVECLFGPCTPYQYRLTGPGVWPGARQAIMTQWERVRTPLNTRPLPQTKGRPKATFTLTTSAVTVGAIIVTCLLGGVSESWRAAWW